MFITLEGPDGSGKTTQARLLAEWLRERGYEVVLTREPGGSDIGDQIRAVLHDPRNTAMNARAEILLYSASRAQHVAQRIRPALAAGKIVVSDRYADSTLAYQGYGRGLDLETLRTITVFATGGLTPDLTLYLDVVSPAGAGRLPGSGRAGAGALGGGRRRPLGGGGASGNQGAGEGEVKSRQVMRHLKFLHNEQEYSATNFTN
jgi:dTMP kinase